MRLLLEALVIGVISSSIATIFFFLVRQIVRPKIAISDQIVLRYRKGMNKKYHPATQIKIINRTRFDIEEVKFRLYLIREEAAGQHRNQHGTTLNLAMRNCDLIRGRDKRDKRTYNNCCLITYKGDIRKLLDTANTLLLQVTATHSKSGFRKVFTREFLDANHFLKEGYFESGETFRVIPKEFDLASYGLTQTDIDETQ